MANWVSFPKVEGVSSRQAHTDLPEGSYERELGKEGFFGPATQMYHKHPPTSWEHIDGPLMPRAFDSVKMTTMQASPWDASLLLSNACLQMRIWKTDESMQHLVRNADGDELLFVHQGEAQLFCDHGHLAIREGDYVVLPRGELWRIEIKQPLIALLIEATNTSYKLPDKGLVGQHAIFDPAIIDTPCINDVFKAQQHENTTQVQVKRRNQISTITYPFNPLDAIGWHGDLMPIRVNWRDFRPLMSHRYHVPPSAHTTFLTDRFVVCTFCPRPLESDPGALKVPFFHNNDDYDEVIFYHQGQFFSRDNIHPGMITLHPSGITHGPHPKAFEVGRQAGRQHTDEVALMIDTRDALDVHSTAKKIEWDGYVKSWCPD